MDKIRVAINGFGRIGQGILRAYATGLHHDIELVAINFASGKLKDNIHFLKYDSVHGHFDQVKQINNDTLEINGKKIQAIFTRDISKINWSNLGVDLVLECSGAFNDKELSYAHIKSGAKKVLVSAPCKNADSTIVYGVNTDDLKPSHEVISIGSCTTNCLAPIAKVLDENFGIESGFMTTIHSYTKDQRLLDGKHKDLRRARAATLSMIPTTTGAAKSIGLVLPKLSGRLDGAAIRVPVPNVSMIDLKFTCRNNISVNLINDTITKASNDMLGILKVNDEELVSIDFNGDPHSAIFDTTQTRVVLNNFCRVVAWYDNECGFSYRMLDITSYIRKIY